MIISETGIFFDLVLCFVVYLNTTLISWYSKKESTIGMYKSGAENVAMKTCIKTLQGNMLQVVYNGHPYCWSNTYLR